MSPPPAIAGRVSFVALCAATVATAFQKFGTVWYQEMPLQGSDVAVLVAALAWLWHVAGARELRWSPFYLPFALWPLVPSPGPFGARAPFFPVGREVALPGASG